MNVTKTHYVNCLLNPERKTEKREVAESAKMKGEKDLEGR